VKWVGRVHEALVGAKPAEAKVLPGVLFWEVPKSAEGHRAKLERDLVVLREETRDKPDDPRWWYYLGQTLQGLKQPREAVEAFKQCASLPGWAEQAAWACYKGAECLVELKEFTPAIELCALGLARQPGSPELAWLAGWCCYQAGKLNDAIHWERIAIALGNFEGSSAGDGRISFRHLPGWYEGPYDVLRWAYRKLGNAELSAEAALKFDQAMAVRNRGETR
jgi:tetratricopeptide (TPR) repeat protein